MSDTSNRNHPKPQFRGFTDIFRRVNEDREDPAQTSPNRNFEPSAYEPCRSSSHKSETFEQTGGRPVVEQPIQPEKSSPMIAVPPLITYEEWFADRLNQAVARCRELYGPIEDEFGQAVDEDVRRLAGKIRRCISGGGASDPHEQSCQCVDCRTSANNRKEIYEGRDVNTYPQKYEFELLNNRYRKIVTNKGDPRWLREFVRGSILRDTELMERDQEGEYDRYGAEREELTQLLNERLGCPPSKRISFQPENLSEWRAKFAFKVDKKYKYIPKVATSAHEDFHDWLERARDMLDRKRNKKSIERLPERVEAGEVDLSNGVGSRGASLEGRKPSLSHCRSEFYYNGKIF